MRFIVILALALAAALAIAAPVTLIKDGQCHTAIFVAPETMAQKTIDYHAPYSQVTKEEQQACLRESVNDLARYLGKMSGATVLVYTRQPSAEDKVVPILIGSYADAVIGPFTMKTDFKQGYRVAVSAKGIGLQGETDEGASYAIYDLLDRLGCRWYIPGEMGEAIPRLPTITLPTIDLQAVPGTVSRNIWYADEGFKRRNRLGGFPFSAGHALEGYVTKEQLEQHPDWMAEINGKRQLVNCEVGYRICWANPEVVAVVADHINAMLDKNPVPCVSISPGDGMNFCECVKCKALDSGDWDDSMAIPAVTDRYIHFCNQLAELVAKKHPTVKLGFAAYVQFTRPPKREKLHPALIPQLAPITYCRAHTLDDKTCASRRQIKYLMEGWGKASRNVALYEYNFHLAETSAPFPAIKRNTVELPVAFANHVTMWTPETMPNFDNFMPGMYLGIRMSWDTNAKPQAILQEFYTRFYGAAAGPMRDYWQAVDNAWTTVPEHAGCGFSYMRRFTPERMAEFRQQMDVALKACKTPLERQRVGLADDNLRQFELFMKIRRDYYADKFTSLDTEADQWVAMNKALGEKYQQNFAFTRTVYAPDTVSASYFKYSYGVTYRDAARIARDCTIVTPPIELFSFAVDREKNGEAQGWQQPGFNDNAWKQTDVAVDTWYALGLAGYYGPTWYRTKVKVPDLPAGKKVYLWVGATDGACKVFINGRLAQYVTADGTKTDEANGFCEPFSFDITGTVQANAENQVAIMATRNFLNELGTGGLLGPVTLYCEE